MATDMNNAKAATAEPLQDKIWELETANAKLKERISLLTNELQVIVEIGEKALKESFAGCAKCKEQYEDEIATLEKYKAFYDHIQNHLPEGQVVVCKICGKDIEQTLKG